MELQCQRRDFLAVQREDLEQDLTLNLRKLGRLKRRPVKEALEALFSPRVADPKKGHASFGNTTKVLTTFRSYITNINYLSHWKVDKECCVVCDYVKILREAGIVDEHPKSYY